MALATVWASEHTRCIEAQYLKMCLAQSAGLAAGLHDIVEGGVVCELQMLTGGHAVGT